MSLGEELQFPMINLTTPSDWFHALGMVALPCLPTGSSTVCAGGPGFGHSSCPAAGHTLVPAAPASPKKKHSEEASRPAGRSGKYRKGGRREEWPLLPVGCAAGCWLCCPGAGAVDLICPQDEDTDKLLASPDASTLENSWSPDEEKAGSPGDDAAEVGRQHFVGGGLPAPAIVSHGLLPCSLILLRSSCTKPSTPLSSAWAASPTQPPTCVSGP